MPLPRELSEGYLYCKPYSSLTGYIGRIQIYDSELKWEFDIPDEYSDNWENIDILWEEWEMLWELGQTSAISLYIVPVNHIDTETSIKIGTDDSGDVNVTFPAGHLSYVAKKADSLWFAPEYISGEGMFLVFFQPEFGSNHLMGYIEALSGTNEILKTIPIRDKGILKQRKRVWNTENVLSVQQTYQNKGSGLASLSELPFIAKYEIREDRGVETDERHLYYGCHVKESEDNFDIEYQYHFVEE